MLSTGQGGMCYSNEMVLSARNEQETSLEVPMDLNNAIPTVKDRIKPESRKEMDQPHMKTSGGHESREGRSKVTDANANAIPTTCDNSYYEPITPTDKCERADEHTYQPLIHPKPMKLGVADEHIYQPLISPKPMNPGVCNSGGMASHYDNAK